MGRLEPSHQPRRNAPRMPASNACERSARWRGGGRTDHTRLASVFWRTAGRLDLEAIQVENERAEERHRVLGSQPGRSSILPAATQRRGVKGAHARAIGSFEAHMKTNAGACTSFACAIEYPEHRRCSLVWAVANPARALFSARQPQRSQYGVIEGRGATEIGNGD